MKIFLLALIPGFIFSSCSSTMVFKPVVMDCYTLASPVADDIYLIIYDKRENKEYSDELKDALVSCLNTNYNVILLKEGLTDVLQTYYTLDIEEYEAWCENDYCNARTKITITCYQNNEARSVPINKTVNMVNTFNEATAIEALQNSLNEAIRSTVNYIAIAR